MNKTKKQLIFSIIFAVIGLLSIILGIVIQTGDCGEYVTYSRYGADFYTDVQNAIADASNNVWKVWFLLRDCFSYLFYLLGIILIAFAAKSYFYASDPLLKNAEPEEK